MTGPTSRTQSVNGSQGTAITNSVWDNAALKKALDNKAGSKYKIDDVIKALKDGKITLQMLTELKDLTGDALIVALLNKIGKKATNFERPAEKPADAPPHTPPSEIKVPEGYTQRKTANGYTFTWKDGDKDGKIDKNERTSVKLFVNNSNGQPVEIKMADGLSEKYFDLIDRNMKAGAGEDADSAGEITAGEMEDAAAVVAEYADICGLSKKAAGLAYAQSSSFRDVDFKVLKRTKETVKGWLSEVDWKADSEKLTAKLQQGLDGKVAKVFLDLIIKNVSKFKSSEDVASYLIRLAMGSMTEMYDNFGITADEIAALNTVDEFTPNNVTKENLLKWFETGKVDPESEQDVAEDRDSSPVGLAKIIEKFFKFRDKYFTVSKSGKNTIFTFKALDKKQEALSKLNALFAEYLSFMAKATSSAEREQAGQMLTALYALFVPKIDLDDKSNVQAKLLGGLETKVNENSNNLELSNILFVLLGSQYQDIVKAIETKPSDKIKAMLVSQKKRVAAKLIKTCKKLLVLYGKKEAEAGNDASAIVAIGNQREGVSKLLMGILIGQIESEDATEADVTAAVNELNATLPHIPPKLKETLISQLYITAIKLKEPEKGPEGDKPASNSNLKKAIALLDLAMVVFKDIDKERITVTLANDKKAVVTKESLQKAKEGAATSLGIAVEKKPGNRQSRRRASRGDGSRRPSRPRQTGGARRPASANGLVNQGKGIINEYAKKIAAEKNYGKKLVLGKKCVRKINGILAGKPTKAQIITKLKAYVKTKESLGRFIKLS